MAGVEQENGKVSSRDVEEDEMSEDGSVDIEGESEEEFEEEEDDGKEEDANGVDLTQFKRWYSQAGTPRLAVSESYDSAAHRERLVAVARWLIDGATAR